MALRHRELVSATINPTISNRENENANANARARRAGGGEAHANLKSNLPMHVTSRRPALDEIGNKLAADNTANSAAINTLKNPLLKRAETLKSRQPTADKKDLTGAANITTKDHTTSSQSLVAAYTTKQVEEIIDPDLSSQDDPQMVAEYVNDIYEYLRDLETKYEINEGFLEGHQSTPRMRSILVNWLVQVASNFKLCLETLFMSVSLVDRYLQNNKDVGRATLQLVGISSLLVACKYEEMYLPDLQDFVYLCDDSFTSKQILQMEQAILKDLDFSLGKPTAIHFLRRYSKIALVQSDHHTLSKYLLELALMEYTLSHVKPSILAAAASCLSQAILNELACPSKVWTPTLEKYTTYKYADFKFAVIALAHVLTKVDTSKNQAIKSKYSTAAFGKISLSSKLNCKLVRRLTMETPRLRQS